MTSTAFLSGGTRTWSQLLADSGSWTAAWQDGHGMNVGPLPPFAPHTSWLWAWSQDGTALMRVRIDGQDCHTALLALTGGTADSVASEVRVSELHPWSEAAGQVKQYRGPAATGGGLGAHYLCATVDDTGDGGLSFFVPRDAADTGWTCEP